MERDLTGWGLGARLTWRARGVCVSLSKGPMLGWRGPRETHPQPRRNAAFNPLSW